jgi:hypothetical protein
MQLVLEYYLGGCTRRFYVGVERTDTILVLKRMVEDRAGIPIHLCEITYRNKPLSNSMTIEQYGIEKDSRLTYSDNGSILCKFIAQDSSIYYKNIFQNTTKEEIREEIGNLSSLLSITLNCPNLDKNDYTYNPQSNKELESSLLSADLTEIDCEVTLLDDPNNDSHFVHVRAPINNPQRLVSLIRAKIKNPLICGLDLEIRKGRKPGHIFHLPREIWKMIIAYLMPQDELIFEFRYLWPVQGGSPSPRLEMKISGNMIFAWHFMMDHAFRGILFHQISIQEVLQRLPSFVSRSRFIPLFDLWSLRTE